jgi:hypothetical protein
MHLLASYTSKGPLELHLHDLETREIIEWDSSALNPQPKN